MKTKHLFLLVLAAICCGPHVWGQQLREGIAVTTNWCTNSTDAIVKMWDVSNTSAPSPIGSNWNHGDNWGRTFYRSPDWTAPKLGQVFGLAMNTNLNSRDYKNIYVSTTQIYGVTSLVYQPYVSGTQTYSPFVEMGNGATPAATADNTPLIWKIDPVANTYEPLVVSTSTQALTTNTDNKIFNRGTTIGNICYDADHDQIFATNMEDGSIYRINANSGHVLSRYRLFSSYPAGSGSTPVFPHNGEKLWGIAYGGNKLYFSRWVMDTGRPGAPGGASGSPTKNEIYEVDINPVTGDFVVPACTTGVQPPALEYVQACSVNRIIEVPYHVTTTLSTGTPYSNPVSDIEISGDGSELLLAERTMQGDYRTSGATGDVDWAHRARLMRYSLSGGIWSQSNNYRVGNLVFWTYYGAPPIVSFDYSNSAGGVDFGYDTVSSAHTNDQCESRVWVTGDALERVQNGYTGGHNLNEDIYGFAGISKDGLSNDPNDPSSPTAVNNASIYQDMFDPSSATGSSAGSKNLLGDIDVFRTVCRTCSTAASMALSADTICAGQSDTAYGNGGAYGSFILTDQVGNVVQTSGTLTVPTSGDLSYTFSTAAAAGDYTICYTAYSKNPTDTIGLCTSPVCKTLHVKNCCVRPTAVLTVNGSAAPVDTICYGDSVTFSAYGAPWGKIYFVDEGPEDHWSAMPQNLAAILDDPAMIGLTNQICLIVSNDTAKECADTICRTIYVKQCCTKPNGILGTPDTICAGTWDTIQIGGAPYFKFVADGNNPNEKDVLPTDSFNRIFGGLPINPDGWSIGTHHICLIYYSADPDSVSYVCTDTICRTIVVRSCGCEVFRGKTLPIVTQADGFVYDFTNSGDDGDFSDPGPDFINWYVDGVLVGQTTDGNHLTDTLTPGSHTICMDAAHILFNAGPNGNSICCYDRQCTAVNIDACISWKATDSITFSYDTAGYRNVIYTFHGSTSPLFPTIVWYFGDGSSTIGHDLTVSHHYGYDNDYTVCAVVIWSKGDSITYDSLGVCCCVDTICLPVSVSPCSITDFGIAMTADGNDHSYHVTHSAGMVNVTYVKWTVGTDVAASTRPEHGVFMNFTGSDAIYTVCAKVDYNITLPGGLSQTCTANICISDTFGDALSVSRSRIYPNPTTGDVVIEITNYQPNKNALIEIYDVTGQMVMSEQWNALSKGTSQNVLNVRKLPAGVYTTKVTIDDMHQVTKLIKQ